MASVYATFAARGMYCQPHPVTAIEDRDGEQVEHRTTDVQAGDAGRRSADAVNDILRGVHRAGRLRLRQRLAAAASRRPARPARRNDNKAVWFDGYTPEPVHRGDDRRRQPAQPAGALVTDKYVGGAYSRFDAVSGSGLAGADVDAGDAGGAAVAARPGLPSARHQRARRCSGDRPVAGRARRSARRRRSCVDWDWCRSSARRSTRATPTGTVAYTSPGSGDAGVSGQQVTLYISDGTPYVPPTTAATADQPTPRDDPAATATARRPPQPPATTEPPRPPAAGRRRR